MLTPIRGDQPRPFLVPDPASAPKAAVVFDLDGVLVDVSSSYRQAIAHTVAALGGGDVTPQQVQAMKNSGGYNNDWDLSQELLRQRGRRVELARVIEVFNQFYLGPQGDGEGGLIELEQWLLPMDLLAALRQRYRLSLFTGRPRTDANYVLQRFQVSEAFDHVITHEDVSVHKPDPEGLYELKRLYAPMPIALYVGDSIDDARCAAAAEVDFAAILTPGQPQEDELEALFAQCGHRCIVPDVTAAVRWLLNQEPLRAGTQV